MFERNWPPPHLQSDTSVLPGSESPEGLPGQSTHMGLTTQKTSKPLYVVEPSDLNVISKMPAGAVHVEYANWVSQFPPHDPP